MKNVPIKFRGRFWLKNYIDTSYEDGDIVYGGYAHVKFLYDDGEGDYIVTDSVTAVLVHPDSVAQLVGYDAEGNEVYEGDKIYDAEHDDIVIAELYANVLVQFYKKVDDNV